LPRRSSRLAFADEVSRPRFDYDFSRASVCRQSSWCQNGRRRAEDARTPGSPIFFYFVRFATLNSGVVEKNLGARPSDKRVLNPRRAPGRPPWTGTSPRPAGNQPRCRDECLLPTPHSHSYPCLWADKHCPTPFFRSDRPKRCSSPNGRFRVSCRAGDHRDLPPHQRPHLSRLRELAFSNDYGTGRRSALGSSRLAGSPSSKLIRRKIVQGNIEEASGASPGFPKGMRTIPRNKNGTPADGR